MEHIKELLKSRIAEIQDPVQKILLQDVLVDVFGELLGYSEACFAELEKKLDGERKDTGYPYAVYTGICKKDGVDNASRSLFEIGTAGEEPAVGYLGTLFLACDYPSIRRCLAERFPARIETDLGDYQTTVRLTYCSAYRKLFAWLYRQFGANQKQWHTINCPFAYKLLDITDLNSVVPAEAVIGRVEIELGAFSDYVINDMVLVWNVSREICKPKTELEAAGNMVYYAHRIPLPDPEAGYLVRTEEEELISAVFSEAGMVIRTQKEEHKNMELIKICKLDTEKDHTALQFPLQTNRRHMRHADRQASGQVPFVWTRGEVERFLSSYEVFRDFEFAGLCMDMPGEMEAIDMNPFIRVHSFLKHKRKAGLILHPKDSTDIFRYEKMFFLLSELQLYTQEYEWTGSLR